MSINQELKTAKSLSKGSYVHYSWKRWLGNDLLRVGLVSTLVYQWENFFGNKAFYKFYDKPKSFNKYYRPEQSWCEILDCKREEVEKCLYGTDVRLKPIATKITKELAKESGFANTREMIKHLLRTSEKLEHLILVTKDSERRTWHFLNARLLLKLLKEHNAELMAKHETQEVENNLENNYADEVDAAFGIYDEFNVSEEDVVESNQESFWKNKGKPLDARKVKKTTAKQREMFDAVKMPELFAVSESVIAKAISRGYLESEVRLQLNPFYYYYKKNEKGKKVVSLNWDDKFLEVWLTNSYDYGKIKLNGKYKDGTTEKLNQTDEYAKALSYFK